MPNGVYQVGGIPYGNAFIVNTPNLDRIGKEYHAQQLQQDKQYKDDSQKLDDEFAKNVSQIKDIDVDDLTTKYNDYKQTWKQLNKPGTTISPQDQLKLLRKKADVLGFVNSSKKEKHDEELSALDVNKNPNNFNDDAHQFLINRRNTPTLKLDDSQKDIYGNILYKGNSTDFTGLHKKAEGNLQPRGVPITTKSTDGLTSTDTSFKAGNSPAEYADILDKGIKGSIGNRDFLMQHQFTEDEGDEIMRHYLDISKTPEFKAAWGDGDIPESLFLSKKGRAIALTAMQHAIEHPPTAIVSKPYNNTGAVMDKKSAQARSMENLKNYHILARKSHEEGVDVNDIFNKIDLNQDSGDINTTMDGKPVKAARINTLTNDAQQVLMKSFKDAGNDVTAADVYSIRQPDKSIIYYKVDDNGQPVPSEKYRIFQVSRTGVNLKAQANAKGKVEVVKQGEPTKSKLKNNPLGLDL